MSSTSSRDLPATVVVFGGSSKTYHEPIAGASGVEARCGARGKNPFLKDRAVIEIHYRRCGSCFPSTTDAGDGDPGAEETSL